MAVNKGGRPLKELDRRTFEKLCGLQCTKEEICGWFDITDKTLEKWCRRTYQDENGEPMGFSEVFRLKRSLGKISLRRNQFQLAERSASMAIWLGKNYLGQKDSVAEIEMSDKREEDALTKSLREEAKRMEDENENENEKENGN